MVLSFYYSIIFLVIQELANALNNRFIEINGTLTSFKPNKINEKNLNSFIAILQEKNPAYYFSDYVVDASDHEFPFKVGDLVYIKLKSLSDGKLTKIKRSERSITKRIYKISDLFLYISKALLINEGALISQVYPRRLRNIKNNLSFFKVTDLIAVPKKIIQKLNL